MQALGAREVAAKVLVRVIRDDAFAAAALDAELGRARQLDARDRAFATELAYGALRVLPWLEERVSRHVARGLDASDARLRAELVLAAYQLFFLSRVPAFAAVHEAVSSVRRARGDKVARFANAVLRRLSEEAGARDDEVAGRELEEATLKSIPEWLREALGRSLGADGARAFAIAGHGGPPPTGIRVDRGDRDVWLARLREEFPLATLEAGKVSPLAILARGAGLLRDHPAFRDGSLSTQEEGSQLIALALGARPGDRVLDACAGRGNKSAILARAVAPSGALDAADAHPNKLERLASELARSGLSARATFAVDWSVGSGDIRDTYDRILVDAPCSGIGTLRRRPEIVLRRKPDDLTRLAELQRTILLRAAGHVAKGGRILYAVCSVLREEAEEVVLAAIAADPSLVPTVFDSPAARAVAGEGATSVRLLPHVHGTDGYFLASFTKKE